MNSEWPWPTNVEPDDLGISLQRQFGNIWVPWRDVPGLIAKLTAAHRQKQLALIQSASHKGTVLSNSTDPPKHKP